MEVRHPAFFAKGETKHLRNQVVCQRCINRVILNSSAVHKALLNIAAVRDAQQKKLTLPVHSTPHWQPAAGALYRR